MKVEVAGIEIVIYKIDLNLIWDYKWGLNGGRLRGCKGKYRGQYLHLVIAERMGLNPDKRIYHKNKNCLDFRRPNLIDFSPLQESIRKNALIDGWNMDLIERYNWCLCESYLRVWVNGKHRFLHHLIAERMGLDLSNDIDHTDRNPSNNRESNLREATRSQNAMNRKRHSNNTSGYPGVHYCKRTQKWVAQITINYKTSHLGYFKHEKDAIVARRAAEIKYFGEYRRK